MGQSDAQMRQNEVNTDSDKKDPFNKLDVLPPIKSDHGTDVGDLSEIKPDEDVEKSDDDLHRTVDVKTPVVGNAAKGTMEDTDKLNKDSLGTDNIKEGHVQEKIDKFEGLSDGGVESANQNELDERDTPAGMKFTDLEATGDPDDSTVGPNTQPGAFSPQEGNKSQSRLDQVFI